MRTLKLRLIPVSVLAAGFALAPLAALAYSSDRDFPGTGEGPALSSGQSAPLDFGFSSPSNPGAYGLRPFGSQQSLYLNETQSLSPAAQQRQSKRLRLEMDQFNRDFYGYR